MEPIRRGKGVTQSERYLARLADSTFLELWSYPNTFIDKRSAPTADGKELADLLAVCGDDVIIFSDKSVAWPSGRRTPQLAALVPPRGQEVGRPNSWRRALASAVPRTSVP